MKNIFALFVASMALLCSTTGYGETGRHKFPKVNQDGKIAVVAHRGFWNCEQGGFSENSIASLKAAQDNGLWGSECDIHLTSDGQVIVNHNHDVDGLKIASHTFAELREHKLPNGECRPSFEEYVVQAAECKTTMLVVEFKIQPSEDIEDKLVESAVRTLKRYRMFRPDRVLFISFSEHICRYIADRYPKFVNQFLTSDRKNDMHPSQFADKGINGVDYHYKLFLEHPEWVAEAKANNMSVNVWTVNDDQKIQKMIDLGVDAITSNNPLLVRRLLGEREYGK